MIIIVTEKLICYNECRPEDHTYAKGIHNVKLLKPFFLLAVIALISALLFGCSKEGTPDKSAEAKPASTETKSASGETKNAGSAAALTIKHDLGETPVPSSPQKIVVLELGFIDALLDVGVKPTGVADDNKPNLIAAEVLKKIEGYTPVGTRAQPSLEKIKMLQPDLIIADTDRHKNTYAELSKIAPTIALKNLNANYEDTLKAALTVAEAVGKRSEMEKVIEAHKTKLKALQAKAPQGKPSVLLVGNTDSEIAVRSPEFFTSQLLMQFGYTYALKDASKYAATSTNANLTLEQLLEIDPDTIVLMSADSDKRDKEGSRPIQKDPLWKDLKAVKNKQVYEVDRYAWSLRRSVQGANVMIEQAENLLFAAK